MSKCHVKKGDEVVVIAGAEKGKRGKIISINTGKQRVCRVAPGGQGMMKNEGSHGQRADAVHHPPGLIAVGTLRSSNREQDQRGQQYPGEYSANQGLEIAGDRHLARRIPRDRRVLGRLVEERMDKHENESGPAEKLVQPSAIEAW